MDNDKFPRQNQTYNGIEIELNLILRLGLRVKIRPIMGLKWRRGRSMQVTIRSQNQTYNGIEIRTNRQNKNIQKSQNQTYNGIEIIFVFWWIEYII